MTDSTLPATITPQLGRLLNEQASPATDPRAHPALVTALGAFGLDALNPEPPFGRDCTDEEFAGFLDAAEEGFEAIYANLPNDLPGDAELDATTTRERITIEGDDGNQIDLHVFRPTERGDSLPCVVYLHGGGMAILSTTNKVHVRWCMDLASTGTVAVAVDFRNAYSSRGMNPFPAGLHDCVSAVKWISEHRNELGISSLVVQGESGGANLAIATALSASDQNWVDSIGGIYAMDPYISGGYGWSREHKLHELPSLIENDGYFINCGLMDLLEKAYDPADANADNPLCWPYFASVEQLRGLPPHLVSVNEIDPLRDEGLAYFRKLLAAGVPAVGKTNTGLTHVAELVFRQALPDVYWSTIADINRFAHSVTKP